MTVVWGTGHRPEDAGMDYLDICTLINRQISVHPRKIKVAICGMAAGFDLAWGMEALNNGIEVWAFRPWAGHKPRAEDRRKYEWILKNAKRVAVVDPSERYPGPWVYDNRNKAMVDNGDEGIAFWSGKQKGGTFNCVTYADKVGKEYVNIYPS